MFILPFVVRPRLTFMTDNIQFSYILIFSYSSMLRHVLYHLQGVFGLAIIKTIEIYIYIRIKERGQRPVRG